MKKKTQDKIMFITGVICKAIWHLISLIIAFKYVPIIGFMLIGIWIFHQIVSLWYVKGKSIKCTIERKPNEQLLQN